MPVPDPTHYRRIVRYLTRGTVIPFLGAGVNLCDRPPQASWSKHRYLPSGGELAEHLAEQFFYPDDDRRNLLRISQYAAIEEGAGELYDHLREVFDGDYPPTTAHRLLAQLPVLLREKGYLLDPNAPPPDEGSAGGTGDEWPDYPLIVTTNYDDLMERALEETGQQYDVVSYVADGTQRGKFLHRPPAGDPVLIEKPNQYSGLNPRERPVVFKIHGAIDRDSRRGDSYVITEDHYIDYLARIGLSELIPATLLGKFKTSHFLFLGYSLSDWNLRVILHRLWGDGELSRKSWAVQLHPAEIEEEFWSRRGVEIFDLPLSDYVTALRDRVQELEPRGGAS